MMMTHVSVIGWRKREREEALRALDDERREREEGRRRERQKEITCNNNRAKTAPCSA